MQKVVLKIDKVGRLVIPKEIRELINLGEEVSYEVDVTRGTLTLYNKINRSIRESIKVRLNNKEITKSERNFLEKLLMNLDIE